MDGGGPVDFTYDGRDFMGRSEWKAYLKDGGGETHPTNELTYGSDGTLYHLSLSGSLPGGIQCQTGDNFVFHFAGRPVATWFQSICEYLAPPTYYVVDHLGTPILTFDEFGNGIWEGGFEPFGEDYSPTPTDPGEHVVSLRFPGQVAAFSWGAAGTGLYYNVNRWYEPETGRYSRPNPVFLAGYSPYSYALSDPINIKDSMGLLPEGTDADTTCLVCTVFAESRGQSGPCQQAVASVIVNRLAKCRNWGIVVSRHLGGDLLAFQENGSLVAHKAVNETTWLHLFDFDEDGVAEVVTEQVDGRGTGVLLKSYYVYRVSPREIVELWKNLSYRHALIESREQPGATSLETHRGYLRCEPSGSGRQKPGLLYLVEVRRGEESHRTRRQAFVLEGDSFAETTWDG